MRRSITFTAAILASLGIAATAGCNNKSSSSPSASTTSASTANSSSDSDIGEVIATVDSIPIGSKEFQQAAARRVPENGTSLSEAERKEVLDQLIAEKLLYKEALAKGLDKDPKVQKVMVNALLRDEVYTKVRNSDFTNEELQAYYDAHKDEFVVPEKVQIKRILIKVTEERPDAKAQAEAEQIRARLVKNPESFKEEAVKHSEDPYRRRGGDVGFVSRDGKPGLDPEVVKMAFQMKVGEISPVFKSTDGYNIIMVPNRRDRIERTFQQMKSAVLRKVKNEKVKELYEQYVDQLKKGADVRINEDKLALVDVKSLRRPMGPGFALNPALKKPPLPADQPKPDAPNDAEATPNQATGAVGATKKVPGPVNAAEGDAKAKPNRE